MIETRATRFAAVLVLLFGVFTTCVWFGALQPNADEGRYPYAGHVIENEQRYVGGPVVINGEVVNTDPVRVEASYTVVRDATLERGTAMFTVTDIEMTVESGDRVQVYGALETDRTAQSREVVITPSRNFPYMYAVSMFAGLWVLARLVVGWRLDWATLTLEPRRNVRGLFTAARRRIVKRSGDRDDA